MQPGDWRLVDHQVDGFNCARSILPALILEPAAKGSALLASRTSERIATSHFAMALCATPLPDNLGDLLVTKAGGTVEWYHAHFQFVALTLNSD